MILGLDLQGTRLGWALLTQGGDLHDAGVIHLGRREEPGVRRGTTRRVEVPALRAWDIRRRVETLLETRHAGGYVRTVAYEKVRYHGLGQVESAHLWGAAEMAVLEAVYRHGLVMGSVELRQVGVSAAKLALTGNGGADKPAMALAAAKRWPAARVDWSAGDHDAADAAGVALSVIAPGESKAAKAKRLAAERRAARGAA